jgi:beta-aspartyl-dipeptidase (metallo-type)
MENLYAKAKALETQGITTYIYSGSYSVPPVTLTGSMTRDLVLIDKVLGAGEIAISDHRSSQPDLPQLKKLSADTHLGGLLSGKAGVVHLHIGDGKEGLEPLFSLLEETDLPVEQFVPTHVNRNAELFGQAVECCRSGGNIDLTAGETAGIPVSEAVFRLKKEGLNLSRVTVSSDAGGSIPGGGSSKPGALYSDLREIIKQSVLPPEEAICLFTAHVAKVLKLSPSKGGLSEGNDADLLIMDHDQTLIMLFSGGKLLVNHYR